MMRPLRVSALVFGLLVGSLVTVATPALGTPTVYVSSYMGCLAQDWGAIGGCLQNQFAMDASGINQTRYEVKRSIRTWVDTTGRRLVGPKAYGSAKRVYYTEGFLEREYGKLTLIFRRAVGGEMTATEIDQAMTDIGKGFFDDATDTLNKMHDNVLRTPLKWKRQVEYWNGEAGEKFLSNFEQLKTEVAEFREDYSISWGDEGTPSPGAGDAPWEPSENADGPDVLGDTKASGAAGDSADSDTGFDESQSTVAAQQTDPSEGEPAGVAEAEEAPDLQEGEEEGPFDLDEDVEYEDEAEPPAEPQEDPYRNYREYAAEYEDQVTEIGVTDIEDYESNTLEDLNRRWDEDHERIMDEIGAVEIGVTRVGEDPADPLAQLDQLAGEMDTDSQVDEFLGTLELDRGVAGRMEQQYARVEEDLRRLAAERQQATQDAIQMGQAISSFTTSLMSRLKEGGIGGAGRVGGSGGGDERAVGGWCPSLDAEMNRRLGQATGGECARSPLGICMSHKCNLKLIEIYAWGANQCPKVYPPERQRLNAELASARANAQKACAMVSVEPEIQVGHWE